MWNIFKLIYTMSTLQFQDSVSPVDDFGSEKLTKIIFKA